MGVLSKWVFVIEATAKKQAIGLLIEQEGGSVSNYSDIGSYLKKGFKGIQLVHRSVLGSPQRLAKAISLCKTHSLSPLHSSFIEYAAKHNSSTEIPSRFLIDWDSSSTYSAEDSTPKKSPNISPIKSPKSPKSQKTTSKTPSKPAKESPKEPVTTKETAQPQQQDNCESSDDEDDVTFNKPSRYDDEDEPSIQLKPVACDIKALIPLPTSNTQVFKEDESDGEVFFNLPNITECWNNKNYDEALAIGNSPLKLTGSSTTKERKRVDSPDASESDEISSKAAPPKRLKLEQEPTPTLTATPKSKPKPELPPATPAATPKGKPKPILTPLPTPTPTSTIPATPSTARSVRVRIQAKSPPKKTPKIEKEEECEPRESPPPTPKTPLIAPKTPKKTPRATPRTATKAPKTPQVLATKTPRKTPKADELARLLATDPLQYVIQTLAHSTGAQVEFAGRDIEFEKLFSFCKDCIESHKAGSVYLCGKPGTGKSLTVENTTSALTKWAKSSYKLEVISVNCNQTQDPKDIFGHVLRKSRHFSGEPISNPEKELESLLFHETRMTIVVLDEIDNLLNRQSSILYKLFEWASHKSSSLVLIGISNVLDLVNHKLTLLTKGLAKPPEVIAYKPYTAAQLSAVINSRVAVANIFDSAAIDVCARKVASIDGDVRKALDICLEAARSKVLATWDTPVDKVKIGVGDMVGALKRQFPSEVDRITALTTQAQTVLCAAVVLPQGFSQDQLHASYLSICKQARLTSISPHDFNDIVETLKGYSLLDISYFMLSFFFLFYFDSTNMAKRKKTDQMSVPLTKEDLMDGMDTTLQAVKSILQRHCQQP